MAYIPATQYVANGIIYRIELVDRDNVYGAFWLIDPNNNRQKIYGDDAASAQLGVDELATLINCRNCVNCFVCKNCVDCINCYHCEDCVGCENSNDLLRCNECTWCGGLSDCQDCGCTANTENSAGHHQNTPLKCELFV